MITGHRHGPDCPVSIIGRSLEQTELWTMALLPIVSIIGKSFEQTKVALLLASPRSIDTGFILNKRKFGPQV